MITVLPMSSRITQRGGLLVVSTVSSAHGWQQELSPFILGPCDLYDGYSSKNMENAWQFSKVYKQHLGPSNLPSSVWWRWAVQGWSDIRAHRYPMGKGRKPEYSYWMGDKLDYIQARKVIYGPLYAEAVKKTSAYLFLKKMSKEKDIVLLDYDAYDHRRVGMSLTDVLNNPTRKMGHAFVLMMLLTKDKALKEMELR